MTGLVSHNQEWTTIKGPRQRRFVALLAFYTIIFLDILVFILVFIFSYDIIINLFLSAELFRALFVHGRHTS